MAASQSPDRMETRKVFVDEFFFEECEPQSNLASNGSMVCANSHFVNNRNKNDNSPGPNCLNILYYNARSLFPKLDKLKALVDTQRPHIVCIVETWLSSEIADNEVSLEGFQMLHLGRNRHGGGIMMFVHNYIVPKVIVAGPNDLELLIILLLIMSVHC